MSPLLHNVPMIHNNNQVRAANSSQAVGNDKTGPASHELVEGHLDLELGISVDGRGRLIQQ